MKKLGRFISSYWALYRDGYKNTSWGRPLVWVIILKLFIMFAVLRVFFFKPAMKDMSEEQKIEQVSERLITHKHDTLKTLIP